MPVVETMAIDGHADRAVNVSFGVFPGLFCGAVEALERAKSATEGGQPASPNDAGDAANDDLRQFARVAPDWRGGHGGGGQGR
jgi:hypothetical protein